MKERYYALSQFLDRFDSPEWECDDLEIPDLEKVEMLVNPGTNVETLIRQAYSLLSEPYFPWERFRYLGEYGCEDESSARQWLTEIIEHARKIALSAEVPPVVFEPLGESSEDLLWHLLLVAAHENDLRAAQANPELARYVFNWGRRGDFGTAAFFAGYCVGAAWCRIWRGPGHGFGFVSTDIPELSVAVQPDYQGQGIGSRLIKATLEQAGDHYPAVSLSVREGSRAVRLYEQIGFERLPGTEIVNRTGGISFTMVCRLG